jgi:integrase
LTFRHTFDTMTPMKRTPTEFPKEKPKTFPFRAGRGSAAATMYRVSDKGYDVFKLPYQDNGHRKFHRFSDYEGARKKGNEMLDQLVRGDVDAITLGSIDKVIYCRALDLARPLNMKLDAIVQQFVEAHTALTGLKVSVAEAARSHAKRFPATMPDKSVAEVVSEFIKSKTASKLSARYIEDLRYRLGDDSEPQNDPDAPKGKKRRPFKRSFAQAFQTNIARIEGGQIRDFLAGLNLSPRSYNNFRCAIVSLFEFAKSRRYLPSDWNEFDGVDSVKDNGGAIEIFTPEELDALLTVRLPKPFVRASAQLLPFLAIGAFAGLRSAEIDRLEWQDVKFSTGYIVVEKGKAKTATRRIVPMSDNLKAWLQPYAKTRGKVWPHGHAYLYEVLQATAKAAKVPWKQNALRHSFISYRVADTGDVNRIALEAGNSPAMIFSNYRELVTPEDGKRWFSIIPQQPENLLDLPKGQVNQP